MSNFFDFVYKLTRTLCQGILVLVILITSMSVLGRYVDFIPNPPWTEEIVLVLMAYMAVLSASLAIRTRSHIRMTSFDRYLPERVILWLDILADVCVLGLSIVMITVGWSFARDVGAIGTFVSIPTLSSFWQFFPIPLAGVAMFIFEIELLGGHFKRLAGKGGTA